MFWDGLIDGCGQDCVVILVPSGSSTSSMSIFRDNSHTFRWSGMALNGFCMVILVRFSFSKTSMCIFSWQFSSGMVLNGFHMAHKHVHCGPWYHNPSDFVIWFTDTFKRSFILVHKHVHCMFTVVPCIATLFLDIWYINMFTLN